MGKNEASATSVEKWFSSPSTSDPDFSCRESFWKMIKRFIRLKNRKTCKSQALINGTASMKQKSSFSRKLRTRAIKYGNDDKISPAEKEMESCDRPQLLPDVMMTILEQLNIYQRIRLREANFSLVHQINKQLAPTIYN